MPHPAVLFSCFCSLCILHLKNIRTGRSILVNDISDGLQQPIRSMHRRISPFFTSHKNVGHMILLQQAQHFIRIGRGVHLFHVLGADIKSAGSPLQSHSWTYHPSTVGRPVIAETRS